MIQQEGIIRGPGNFTLTNAIEFEVKGTSAYEEISVYLNAGQTSLETCVPLTTGSEGFQRESQF